MTEFIYFIGKEDSEDGPIKIGITTTSIQSRMRSLQTASPFKLKCFDYIAIDDGYASRVEGILHRLLSKKRIHGEWFDISPSEVVSKSLEALMMLDAGGETTICDHGDFIP